MKSLSFSPWSVAMVVLLPLVGGCVQEAASVPEQPSLAISSAATSGPPVPAPVPMAATTNTLAAEEPAPTNAPPTGDLEKAPGTPVAARTLPPGIKPSAAAGEIIKLADAGVDEGVMLAYVTNSASLFNLGAEEIIYLNDIGVSSAVVTAMIQHDQALKDSASASTAAQAAAAAAAAAPLAQPAAPANAPNPADLAPQPAAPQGAQVQSYPAPPATAPTQDTFYESLSPYGTWIDVQGYGRVWQPTVVVVNPGWQPYRDSGRWLYTDAGWYWYSDYSWGWAPFHYGRWFRHHHWGWCWTPDVVWGPAWVTWRYSDAYCGWAPLPPAAHYHPGVGFTYYGASVGVGFSFGIAWDCYSFVGWNHFHHHHVHKHYLPRDHAHKIYDKTVVATRISGTRDRIVNHGVPPERVAAASGSPVRKVTIRETTPRDPVVVRGERLSGDGRTVTVARPKITEPARTAPARVERTTQASIDGNRANTRFAAPPVSRETASNPVRNTESGSAIRSPQAVSGAGGIARPARESISRPQPAAPARVAESGEQTTSPPQTVSRPQTVRNTPAIRPAAPLTRGSGTVPAGTEQNPARVPESPVVRSAPISRPAPATTADAAQRPARAPESPVARPATTPRAATPAPATAGERQAPTTRWQTQRPAMAPENRLNPVSPSAPAIQPAPREARAPLYQAPAAQVPRYAPAPNYQAPAQREARVPAYQAPAPRPVIPDTPRFTPAPVQREYRAPAMEAPRFSNPAPAPVQRAPSFEAPRAVPAAPAPSFSAPAVRPSPPPASVQSGRPQSGRANQR